MYRLKRFYYDNSFDDFIEIKDEIFKHIKVLRFEVGDKIVLQNEKFIAVYQIVEMKRNSILLEKSKIVETELPKYKLASLISVMKREYMDYAVEKMSEIGVTEIIPIITERSIQKINEATILRYQKKAIIGSLQAENNFITKVLYPIMLDEIDFSDYEKIVFYERSEIKHPKILKRNVAFLIGPEGGFTKNEVDTLVEKGFKICSPFKSVLKGETAAVVFAGLLRSEIEKLLL